MKLYRPKGWKVEPGEISGEGTYKVSVLEPEENALVLFATFPVSAEIKDSVALAAVVLEDMKSEFEKLEVLQVSSSPERDRTLARVALTYEGKDGVGHAYFFQTERLGTMYLLLARDGWWEKVQPLLTNVAANIAYAPEGVETVIEKGRKLAEGTGAAASGASPAAIIQEAAKRPGKALQLQEAALPDGSMSIALPRGWILEGQGLQFVLADEPRARLRGVCSVRHTVIPGIQVPGGISSPYLPPPQALSTIVEAGAVGTGLEVLGECPAEGILPESTASAQFLRSQGYQVDSRILHVRFKSKVTGARLRGMFTVDCSTQAMAVVWSCMFTGGWAPEAEFDEYFPLFLRMTKSVRVNEAWMGQEMARRSARQAQLNRNLQNSIAEASKAFDGYMDSLQNSSRSRDYQAWVRSQTTLGQGTWVAENEGARVYQTDSWGIQGPEGRVDSPAYNTTYFTGESPWGDRLEQVDTRAEYEKYIEGR